MEINRIISGELDAIEQAEQVKILYCAEAGSRAWGFASPDSDYDARFVYVRKPEFYLRLEHTRDVIEWKLDDMLDINGWDIRKLLRLLYNSNPVIFEWCNSPIVYRDCDLWQRLRPGIFEFFGMKECLHHYISMARSDHKNSFSQKRIALKKYFYLFRELFACEWIYEKKSPPPMLFTELAAEYLPEELRFEIDRLLKLKLEGRLGQGEHISALTDFAESKIEELSERIAAFSECREKSYEKLDKMFLQALYEQ